MVCLTEGEELCFDPKEERREKEEEGKIMGRRQVTQGAERLVPGGSFETGHAY